MALTPEDAHASTWMHTCPVSELVRRAEFQSAIYSARSLWQRRLVQTVSFIDDSTIKRSMSIDLRGDFLTTLLDRYTFGWDAVFLPVLTGMQPGPILDIDTSSCARQSLNVARRHENIEATTLQIVGTIWTSLDDGYRNPHDQAWVRSLALCVHHFLTSRKETREQLVRQLIGERAALTLNEHDEQSSQSAVAGDQSGASDGDQPPTDSHISSTQFRRHLFDLVRQDAGAALHTAPEPVVDILIFGILDGSGGADNPPPYSFLDEIEAQKNRYTLHLVYVPSEGSQGSVLDDVIKIAWLDTYAPPRPAIDSHKRRHRKPWLMEFWPSPKRYMVTVPLFNNAATAIATHLRVLAPEDMTLGRISVVRGDLQNKEKNKEDRLLLRHWPQPQPPSQSSPQPPPLSPTLANAPHDPVVELIANAHQAEILRHNRRPHTAEEGPEDQRGDIWTEWRALVVLNPRRRYFLAPALVNLLLTLALIIGIHATTRQPCRPNDHVALLVGIILPALTLNLAIPREHALITATQSLGRALAFTASICAAVYALLLAFNYQGLWQTVIFWFAAVLLGLSIAYLLTRITLIECSTIEAFRLRHNLKNLGPTDLQRDDVPQFSCLGRRLRFKLWRLGFRELALRAVGASASTPSSLDRIANWWDKAVRSSTAEPRTRPRLCSRFLRSSP